MKLGILIIIAMLFGAFSYWALAPFFQSADSQDKTDLTLEARLEAQRKVDAARSTQQQDIQVETSDTETTARDEAEQPPTAEEIFGIQTSGPFNIVGTAGHPASGQIEIINSPEEKLVHYKNYEGTAGGQLKVYLARDLRGEDIFDLGDAKDTRGDLIYGVPLSVNISEYRYVVTWDEVSDELFDYAEIN